MSVEDFRSALAAAPTHSQAAAAEASGEGLMGALFGSAATKVPTS